MDGWVDRDGGRERGREKERNKERWAGGCKGRYYGLVETWMDGRVDSKKGR